MPLSIDLLPQAQVVFKKAGYLLIKQKNDSDFRRVYIVFVEDLYLYQSEKLFGEKAIPEGFIKLIAYHCDKTTNPEKFEFTLYS